MPFAAGSVAIDAPSLSRSRHRGKPCKSSNWQLRVEVIWYQALRSRDALPSRRPIIRIRKSAPGYSSSSI
jgi:hypothetical protein